jgi:hypothetical protein
MSDVIVNIVVALSAVKQSTGYRDTDNSRRFRYLMMFEGSTGTGDG